jgi:uroporphyrinogen III methyltransferase/synthase
MSNLYKSSILITRPEQKAYEMAALVKKMNGKPFIFPTIAITEPDNWAETDEAISNLTGFDWVIFSSVNGVRYFFQRFKQTSKSKISDSIKIATVGSKTAQPLQKRGYAVDLIPDSFTAQDLLNEFGNLDVRGKSFLHVTGDKGRDLLLVGLRDMGANVSVIHCYKNVGPAVKDVSAIIQKLHSQDIDFLTFTSPSTFESFYDILNSSIDNFAALLQIQTIATIGPVTTESVERYGISVAVTAQTSTIEGMLTSISEYIHSSEFQTNTTI